MAWDIKGIIALLNSAKVHKIVQQGVSDCRAIVFYSISYAMKKHKSVEQFPCTSLYLHKITYGWYRCCMSYSHLMYRCKKSYLEVTAISDRIFYYTDISKLTCYKCLEHNDVYRAFTAIDCTETGWHMTTLLLLLEFLWSPTETNIHKYQWYSWKYPCLFWDLCSVHWKWKPKAFLNRWLHEEKLGKERVYNAQGLEFVCKLYCTFKKYWLVQKELWKSF